MSLWICQRHGRVFKRWGGRSRRRLFGFRELVQPPTDAILCGRAALCIPFDGRHRVRRLEGEIGSPKHGSLIPDLGDDSPGNASDISSSKRCTVTGNLYKVTG